MITGIILSGGSSRRMGRDKAMLLYKGRPFIQHVTAALDDVCDRVLIIAQPNQDFSFLGKPVIHDLVPGFGALMGLYTGLKVAETPHVLAAACDMPLIRPSVLKLLVKSAGRADVVVPKIKGFWEPLLAVYAKSCLKTIEAMINRREKCVYAFYPEVTIKEIPQREFEPLDPELNSFMNFNTPEELIQTTELGMDCRVGKVSK